MRAGGVTYRVHGIEHRILRGSFADGLRWRAQEAIRVTAGVIAEACNGLLSFLRGVRGPEGPQERPPFREQLRDAVREMDAIEWMVPPMLQKR